MHFHGCNHVRVRVKHELPPPLGWEEGNVLVGVGEQRGTTGNLVLDPPLHSTLVCSISVLSR